MAWGAGLRLDTREEQLCENRCLLQRADLMRRFEKVSTSLRPTCLLILQQSQQSSHEVSAIICSSSRWLATSVSKPTPLTASNCCPPRSVPPASPPPGPAAVFGPAERWMKGVCVCFPTRTVRRQVESRGGSVWVWRTLVPSLETFQAYVRKNCSPCRPNGAPSSILTRWGGCCVLGTAVFSLLPKWQVISKWSGVFASVLSALEVCLGCSLMKTC